MRLKTLRPSYLVKRIRQRWFELHHPDCPWLTESAVLLLDSWLKPTDTGFEWGAGQSTAWFAHRVARLISIEESPDWYAFANDRLESTGLKARVQLHHIPCELHEQDEPDNHPYADIILEFADKSLNFVLVDGNIRVLCMERALKKIKPGGLLILDNANRYIPNPYLRGFSTVHEPRTLPRTVRWAQIVNRLGAWRWISTTDGIWNTRFWIKPPRI